MIVFERRTSAFLFRISCYVFLPFYVLSSLSLSHTLGHSTTSTPITPPSILENVKPDTSPLSPPLSSCRRAYGFSKSPVSAPTARLRGNASRIVNVRHTATTIWRERYHCTVVWLPDECARIECKGTCLCFNFHDWLVQGGLVQVGFCLKYPSTLPLGRNRLEDRRVGGWCVRDLNSTSSRSF